MNCPKCGAENPEGQKLCSECGATLESPSEVRVHPVGNPSAYATSSDNPTQAPKKSFPIGKIIVAIVIALLIILIFVTCSSAIVNEETQDETTPETGQVYETPPAEEAE